VSRAAEPMRHRAASCAGAAHRRIGGITGITAIDGTTGSRAAARLAPHPADRRR
jgi:hypothetical protein